MSILGDLKVKSAKHNIVQEFSIEDIDIMFPYQSNVNQKSYMTHFLQAIKSNSNALLESPTGTGKTMALISAVCGYLQSNSEEKIQVFYASRTHSQLA